MLSRLLPRSAAVLLTLVLAAVPVFPLTINTSPRAETAPIARPAAVPNPQVQWFSPGKVPLGPTTFVVNGSQFISGAKVRFDGVALPTTFISASQLRATSNFKQSGSGYITVVNPGTPDATSTPRLIEFGQGITVKITPSTATVMTGAQQQFVANVTGTSNKTVYWYVNGGSSNGTITSRGLYRAPNASAVRPGDDKGRCGDQQRKICYRYCDGHRRNADPNPDADTNADAVTDSRAPTVAPSPSPTANPSPSPTPSATPPPSPGADCRSSNGLGRPLSGTIDLRPDAAIDGICQADRHSSFSGRTIHDA